MNKIIDCPIYFRKRKPRHHCRGFCEVWLLLLKSFHFFFGGWWTFIYALAWLKVVDNIEGYSLAVVALAFVNENTVCIHGLIVVCRVEYIGCRQFDGQRFVEECFSDRCVHSKPWSPETVGVHIALRAAADVGRNSPSAMQGDSIVEIIREYRLVISVIVKL